MEPTLAPTHSSAGRYAVMPLNQPWQHTEGIGEHDDEGDGDLGGDGGLGRDDFNTRMPWV